MVDFTRRGLVQAPVLFRHPMVVAFQDVDAAGIVFFARIFRYLHDGYAAFLAAHGFPLHVAFAQGTFTAPLVHAEADFLAPMRFGDEVDVCLVAVEVVGSRVSFGFRIEGAGLVRAVGKTVHMFVDRDSFERAPIPGELARVLERIGGADRRSVQGVEGRPSE